jgi:hypothetical protein
MTLRQIQVAVTSVSASLCRDAALEKKLDHAEWKGTATYSIKSSIKLNATKMHVVIRKLAKEELDGANIDFSGDGAVGDLVGEEIAEIKWQNKEEGV